MPRDHWLFGVGMKEQVVNFGSSFGFPLPLLGLFLCQPCVPMGDSVEHWALGRFCWQWASLWGHEWSETADWDPCHQCKIRKLCPGIEHVCIFQGRAAFSFMVSPSLSPMSTTQPLLRDLTFGEIFWSSQAGSSLSLGSSALSYFGGDLAAVSISALAWVWLLERREEGGN